MAFGISIGGNKNKSKSKTSNDVTIDDWSKGIFEGESAKINGLLSQPTANYTGQLSAGTNGYQTAAADAAKGLLSFKPQQVSTTSFADADLSKYLNPETDNVINAALGDVERARQAQKVNDAQGATAAGAWGGSRHGVAEGITNEAAQRTAASTAANLRSQAYDRAASLFNQDREAQLSADQFNAQAAAQAAQLGISGAGLLGQLGSDIQAGEQAGLDRAYTEFLRMYEDPMKRAQLRLGLLNATPVNWDSRGTEKTSGYNLGFEGTFSKSGKG